MAVEQLGVIDDGLGFEKSHEAFRESHETNTRHLLNIAEGKKQTAPRAPFDPDHADAQWPVMVYHAAGKEKVIGASTAGLDPRSAKNATDDNKAAMALALKDGFRKEPYLKPQIAVLDPAAEKQALKDANERLQGQITAQADAMAKLQDQMSKLLEAK